MTCAVFCIYLFLLIWLVLFKFATNISELPSMRSVNLIPFYYAQETNTHPKEVLYNVIVFVPLGVYAQLFLQDRKTGTIVASVLLTSVLFETVQFSLAIGASDITDVIGNTFGGVLGICLCAGMKKALPAKMITVLNCVGIIIEITAIGLLALLLTANR